jgi:transcription termination factor Rho
MLWPVEDAEHLLLLAHGAGVFSEGFGFPRAPEANYLPGPDDVYFA